MSDNTISQNGNELVQKLATSADGIQDWQAYVAEYNQAKANGHRNGHTRKDGTILAGSDTGADAYLNGRFQSKQFGDTKANLAKSTDEGGAGLKSAFQAADAAGKEHMKSLDAVAGCLAFTLNVLRKEESGTKQEIKAMSEDGIKVADKKYTQKEMLAQRDAAVRRVQELEAQNAEIVSKYEQLQLELNK